nr:hypothetical protein [Fredinandcohnia onubensis]
MSTFVDDEFDKEINLEEQDFDEIEVISSRVRPLNLDVEELEDNISVYKNGFDEDKLHEMIHECREVVINSILGPFGLSVSMFDNQEGGNVTTVYNFKKGVTATEEDRERFYRYKSNLTNLDRSEINKDYTKKREVIIERNSAKGNIDAYTNKILEGTPSIEHIKPVATTLRDPKANLAMDNQKLVDVINSEENLVVISKPINSSKRDKTAQDFANTQATGAPKGITNKDKFDLDMEAIKELENRSEQHYKGEVKRALFQKQKDELLKTTTREAGMMAVRKAVGLLLQEFVIEAFNTVKICIKRYKSNAKAKFKQLVNDIWEGLKRLANRIKKKSIIIFKDAAISGIAGVFSNLLTFVINNFVTTAKNILSILREVISAITETVKIMTNKTDPDRAKKGVKIMLAALATSSGIFLLELVKKFLETTPLSPLSLELGNVVVGIVTGLSTILLLFLFNRMKNNINIINKAHIAVESGNVLNQYKANQTLQLLDNAISTTVQKNNDMATLKKSIDYLSTSQTSGLISYRSELDKQEEEMKQLLATLKNINH